MYVMDFLVGLCDRLHVSVVSTPALPEPLMAFAAGLDIKHVLESIGIVTCCPGYGASCDGQFHGREDITDTNALMGQHQQVDVFGHDDKGP